MATKYTQALIDIMERHLPQLEYDLTNATTLYTLQDCTKKLHQILSYVVHHIVEDEYVKLMAARPPAATMMPAVAPPPPPRPAIAPQAVTHPASAVTRMPLPHLGGPAGMPTMGAVSAPAQGGGAKVMDVSITPQGTRVALPGGPVMELPPGSPVEIPEATQPVLNGPNDVVLPPGGGLGPEAQAALAAATGGARNVTNDPPPGQ